MNRVGFAAIGLVVVVLAGAATLFLMPSASATPGDGTLYGTDAGAGRLYSINTTTGVGTFKGLFGFTSAPALAGDPLTGTLYAGRGDASGDFYTVNPSNAATVFVGNSGQGATGYGGMDFDATGQLWATMNLVGGANTGSDYLVKVNTSSGAATIVGTGLGTCVGATIPVPISGGTGTCDLEGVEAIAFDSAGTLWAAENQRGAFGTPGLYKINTTTGKATSLGLPIDDVPGAPIHPLGGVVSMQFACDGTLYAGTAHLNAGDTDSGKLGKINTTTGQFTFISTTQVTTGTPANSLGGLAEVSSTCPFNVNKAYVPPNGGTVTVAVTCTDGGSGTALLGDNTATDGGDDANFTVTGYTLGSTPTCTATETGVASGYTINTCAALLSAGGCTITNNETNTTFAVTKAYSPSGPAPNVAITITCTGTGTVVMTPSGTTPLTTVVKHFPVTGTTCSATETTVPAGYTMTSNCTAVPISNGVAASCTITNTLAPTPNPSAVGGFVDLITPGSSGSGGASDAWLSVLALAVVAMGTVAGGTFAFVRKRS